MSSSSTPVSLHFDEEAQRYDTWKKRNGFYYETLKHFHTGNVRQGESVLELGCGTGDILGNIEAKRRIGTDISPGMIAVAKKKYPTMEWYAGVIGTIPLRETFDVIILSDVIEHLEDVEGTFRDLKPLCHVGTRVVINMANPLWEPLLMVLEKLHMKMPEGPHHRISTKQLTAVLSRHGYILKKREHRMLFPMDVPLLTRFTQAIEKLPWMQRLCLIDILHYEVQ